MRKLILTIATFACLGISYGQNSNSPCPGVTADFTNEALLPAGGIQYTNASQLLSTNGSYTYSWDFGNGQTSNEKDPFMMYDEGTYQVTLTILGPSNCQSSVQKEVEFSYGGK